MQLVWQGPEPAEGLHQLAPAGPWPNSGTLQAKNGRIVWQWQCGRCQARASDSSRALALLRKPCRAGLGIGLERAPHDWADAGAGPTCRRCNLLCGNGRLVEAAGQFCPVPACARLGAAWPEGEASLARELWKVHGFRRWCETSLIELRVANPDGRGGAPSVVGGVPAEPRGVLMPARLHLAVRLGRRWMCLNCFCTESGGVEAFRRARCE